MGLLTRLLDANTRPRAYADDDDIWYGRLIAPTSTGIAIDETNALEVPAVWKCVKILEESISSLPLHMYERDESGDARSRGTDHAYYDLMHTQPNPEMSSMQYRGVQIVHLALWGDSYSEKQMTFGGKVEALWPLSPSRVTPRRTNDDSRTLYYEYRPGIEHGIIDGKRSYSGETILLRRDQVLHIPGMSFNGITGLSPIGYNRESLGLAKATQEFGGRYFSNDARPGGVLEHPGKLGEETAKSLEKRWAAAHSGLSSAHRVAVLEEGMSFNTIGIPPNDAQFLETRIFQDEDIYGMYRIPPHLAGDLEHATYTNIIEQSLEFVIYTLYPWLVRIEQALNIQLLSPKDRKRFYFEHLVDALLRGNPTERWTAYKTGREIGVLSANDIRRFQNMNPIPEGKGGDDYHVPGTWAVAGAPKELPAPTAPPQIEEPAVVDAKIGAQFRPLILDAANRITQKETKRIRKLSGQHNSFDGFYKTFPDYIHELMRPALMAFASAIHTGIDIQPELQSFVCDYSLAMARQHVTNSLADIRCHKGDTNGAIPALMDDWERDRPGEIADREIVSFAKAVEAFGFAANIEDSQ